MNYAKEYSTLIIVGFWNNAIFNPDWVSKFLLANQPFNADIAMNVNGSFRISTDSFRLFVHENRLHFVALKSIDKTFQDIEALARKVADYLPHTPVSSFGVNFVFETEHQGQLDFVCETKDKDNFERAGFKINETSIRRQFTLDGQIINLAISSVPNKLLFDFNYHFNIKTLIDFKDIFEDGILLRFRDRSISLVKDFYKLEVNGN